MNDIFVQMKMYTFANLNVKYFYIIHV